MKHHSRRDVLKELGMGAAALSMGTCSARPAVVVPEGSLDKGASPTSGTVMAIAAHPGDALFTMGSAVALMLPPDYGARRAEPLSSPAITVRSTI